MTTGNQLERVSDIFIQDLSFFGYKAPTIAWIGLGVCVFGSLVAGVYIIGINNSKKSTGVSGMKKATVAGVRG